MQGQRLRACMRSWWSPEAAQGTCMMMSSSSSDMVNTSGPFPVLRPLVALASAALSRSDTFSFTRMPELCMHRRNQHTLCSINFSLSEATHACAFLPPVPVQTRLLLSRSGRTICTGEPGRCKSFAECESRTTPEAALASRSSWELVCCASFRCARAPLQQHASC